MFKTHMSKFMAAVAAMFVSSAVFALERDQIRGELVDVDRDLRSVEVRVLEVGDDVSTRIGRTEVYEIDESTKIEFDVDRPGSFLRTRHLDGFSDLAVGQEVVMDFRLLGERRMATVVYSGPVLFTRFPVQTEGNGINEADEPQYVAQTTRRTSLPDTASPVYSLALLGLGFGLAAGVLRYKRKAAVKVK